MFSASEGEESVPRQDDFWSRAFRRPLLLVGIAAAVFFLLSLCASLVKSPIWDEPYHIDASLSYVETGRIVVNQQHPPLLKELSGLFLRAAGVRWPVNSPSLEAMMNGGVAEQNGIRIITENGPDKVMFWSRLPFILLGTGFVFLIYGLGRELLGRGAALGAVFLFVLDPSMLGHTIFVATDVGLAFFVTLFLLTLWRYLRKPGKLRLLWCGLALGGMLGAKFSAVVMLPVTALLAAAAAFWPVELEWGLAKARLEPEAERPTADPEVEPSIVAWVEPKSEVPGRLMRYGLALAGMCVVAFAVLQYLYLFPKDLLQYIAGMRLVNADHNPNYLYYMAGHLARRFYSYYAVAYLLKEPLAAILAAGVGLAAVLRNKTLPRLALVFLLAPPAALFAGYTLYSDDMGVRYIIPVLPFLHLLGGAGLAALFGSGRASDKVLAAALCLWVVVAAVGIYPDQASYFNEAACLLDDPSKVGWDGGTRCGPAWLDDSNIDWAQGVKQLKTWIDTNARGRQVRVGYFGSFPPAVYGVAVGPSDYGDLLSGTKPGLDAVSAQIVAHARDPGPGHGDWLLRMKPIAVVGHTYYIYDLPALAPGAVGMQGR